MISDSAHPAIAIFAFNRPEHVRSALASLARCEGNTDLDVHIFCDGPRGPEDNERVTKVREICREWVHPRLVLHERMENAGLARSVSEGMDQLFADYETAIVVEDDLILHSDFLRFHRQALTHFADREQVMEISGYRHVPAATDSQVSLLPLASSWGWSTWRRAWQYFDFTLPGWPPSAEMRRRFDMEGAYPYSAIIDRVMETGQKSWAVTWYWAIFRKEGLVAYPPGSLVENIGFDGSGTHCEVLDHQEESPLLMRIVKQDYPVYEWPIDETTDGDLLDLVLKQLRRMAPASVSSSALTNDIPSLRMNFKNDSLIARIQRKLQSLFQPHPPESAIKPAEQKSLVIDESDPYDRAYKWAWEEAGMQELVGLCYKTPDFASNARRFAQSEEFQAELDLFIELGVGPGLGRKALDFGCGNGVATYALALAGYEALGIDSSKGRLAGLGAAHMLVGLDGAKPEFRYHKGEKLDFPDESFDVVFIREVLHHISNLPGFLLEVRRILKNGGVVCCLRDVIVWNEVQKADFFATHPLNHITQDEGCYPLESYVQGFAASGLKLQRLLAPTESVINTYPIPFEGPSEFDYEAARQRQQGYDLFSFFAQKI